MFGCLLSFIVVVVLSVSTSSIVHLFVVVIVAVVVVLFVVLFVFSIPLGVMEGGRWWDGHEARSSRTGVVSGKMNNRVGNVDVVSRGGGENGSTIIVNVIMDGIVNIDALPVHLLTQVYAPPCWRGNIPLGRFGVLLRCLEVIS